MSDDNHNGKEGTAPSICPFSGAQVIEFSWPLHVHQKRAKDGQETLFTIAMWKGTKLMAICHLQPFQIALEALGQALIAAGQPRSISTANPRSASNRRRPSKGGSNVNMPKTNSSPKEEQGTQAPGPYKVMYSKDFVPHLMSADHIRVALLDDTHGNAAQVAATAVLLGVAWDLWRVVIEFVEDVGALRANATEYLQAEWPDLNDTYNKALAVLRKMETSTDSTMRFENGGS